MRQAASARLVRENHDAPAVAKVECLEAPELPVMSVLRSLLMDLELVPEDWKPESAGRCLSQPNADRVTRVGRVHERLDEDGDAFAANVPGRHRFGSGGGLCSGHRGRR